MLYIEADADLAGLVQEKLRLPRFKVELVASYEGRLSNLGGEASYDLLLIHHTPPTCDGPKIVSSLVAQAADLPIVVMVEAGDEKVVTEAIKLGAANYIVKDSQLGFLELLPLVIEQTLCQQQQFRDSEVHYRQLFEGNQAVQLLIEPDSGAIIDANPAAAQFYGYPRQTLRQMNIFELNTLPWEEVAANLAQTKSGQLSHFRLGYKLASGEIKEVEVHSNPVKLNGQALVYTTVYDITEPKQREASVYHSDDIINNVQLGLYIYHLEELTDDRTLRVIAANPAAASFTGVSPQDVLGKKIDDCFPALRAPGLSQAFANVIRTGKAIELEREINFGDDQSSEAWFVFKAFPLPNNCVGVLFEDVTLHKQTEESLRQGERRYRAIIEDQTELICRYLPDGTITFVNEAFCRYYEQSRETLIGQKIIPFISKTSRKKFIEFVNSSDPDNPLNLVEEKVVLPTGEVRWQQRSDRAIFDDHGQLIEFQSVGKDVTALRQAEQEMHRQAQMLAALHETALELAGQRALPDLVWAITRRAVKLLKAQGSTIWIYRPNTDDLELVFNYRLEPDFTGTIFQRGEGLTGQVFETGRPMVVANYSEWEGQSPQYKGSSFGACVSVPISWGKRLLGVLNVVDELPRAFSQDDVALLERFTPLAAAALEQTRLLEETQQRLCEAETLRQAVAAVTQTLSLNDILGRILDELNQVIPHDRASVQLLRKNYTEVVSDRGYSKPDSIVGFRFPVPGDNINTRVVEGRQPIILDQIQEAPPPSFINHPDISIESWLGIPLIVRDEVIGMLALASEKLSYFTKEHIRLVLPFANQVAVAIENARLYEQARQDAATKSVLLNEVNHRVKNNLSAIIGLLYAERRHLDTEKDRSTYQDIIVDLINRVQGLATAHTLLSASEWKPLLLNELVNRVIHSVLQTLPTNKLITVEVTPAPVRVTANQANSLALIINELTTNTIKHGLQEKDIGHIFVQINMEHESGSPQLKTQSQIQEPTIALEFWDNGPGYPEQVLNSNQHNVGLYLVQTLVQKELQGEVTLYNHHGAVTVIRFKANDPRLIKENRFLNNYYQKY